ncbi:MAG: isoprenylcysteine carboxylmethyltransferase family protein [Fimbriimonadales bacterium]
MGGSPPSPAQVHRRRNKVLWLAVLPLAALLVCVAPLAEENSLIEETIEYVGLGLIIAAIFGRTWCTLYIGGRKKSEIVDSGPYSFSRNPLYVFSVLGALGIGMSSGSATLGVEFAVFAFAVFARAVSGEEPFLAEQHGEVYDLYKQRTPRWLSLGTTRRDAETLEVRPHLVLNTFRDACFMLLAVPLFEILGALHASGHLPTLLRLP